MRRMKKSARIIGVALAAAILSLLPWTLLSSGTARADAAAVVVREAGLFAKPNTSAKRVAKLKKGQLLVLRATNGAWSKVLYKGKTGYLARQSIGEQSARVMYAAKDLKVKAKNAVASGTLASVKAGQALYVLDAQGAWCKALYLGHTGFVLKSAVTEEKPSAAAKPTATPKPTASPTPAPEAAYAAKKIRLYKKASTSGGAVGTAPQGAALVRYYYKSGSWAKVKYKGKGGFALLKYITGEPAATPAPTPTPTPKPTPTPTPSPYKELKPGDKGAAVKKLQTRLKALGWFTGTIGGNYQTRTTQAVKDFQKADKLEQTGVATVKTQEALYAKDAPKYDAGGESTATPATGKVVAMDWWTSDIQAIFYRGRTVVVTDVRTGISWREARLGGTKHADCEPLAAKDTAALKKAYGGKWSWDRRPVWVSIGGVRYAASMNGMPHGSGPRDNGFSGHHCIHFVNSRTHGGNNVDPLHQAAIREALAAQ